MSLTQLSPGVNVREIDLTNFIPNVGVSGGAFVGQFSWGPVLDFNTISDSNRLAKVMGKPTDENYVDWYSVSNFLAYTNNCTVVRAVHTTGAVETAFNSAVKTDFSTVSTAAPTVYNDAAFQIAIAGSGLAAFSFVAKYPGRLGNSLKVVVADGATFDSLDVSIKRLFDFAPGTSEYAATLGAKNDEVHVVVIDEQGLFTGLPGTVLEKYAFLSKAKDGKGNDNAPSFYGNVINLKSEYIRYIGSNFAATHLKTGRYGTAAVVDPLVNGTGYVVGDVVTFTAPAAGGRTAKGKVATIAAGEIVTVTLTDVGSGYGSAEAVVAAAISGVGTGADLTKITLTLSATDSTAWEKTLISTTDGAISNYAPLVQPIVVNFTGGDNGGALDSGDLITGWNMFESSEEIDASIMFLGDAGDRGSNGLTAETVVNHVITNIAEKRRDCVVFFSPRRNDVVDMTQEMAAEAVIKFRNDLDTNSSYAVMDSGWKLMYDVYADKYRWVPLNPDVAGLCAAVDQSYDSWWSPAGFTRGKIKGAVSLAYNPNKTQRDLLYSNNVNPVVSFKGDGVVLYGDKTLQTKASAFQYINVRRLFLVLEKSISRAAKYQLFEFNDQFTRAQFRNMVEPYLREVQGRRGVYDFKVVCDETNNTPEIIDRAEFVASIFIKPARSINYITLNFVAVRTGVQFDEVVGAV